MKNALLSVNPNSLPVLERALDAYHDSLAKVSGDWCYMFNTQGKEIRAIYDDEYRAHLSEVERLNALKKQIAYQKSLLKI